MKKQITGKAFLFGNNIDTDQIYPGRFVQYTNVEDVKKYAMYGANKDFVNKVNIGDVIVAGKNFGCGSSREHAAITLKEVGVGAIVAESFGRIFYRNAINLGLPLIICPNISYLVSNEENITIDIENASIFSNSSLEDLNDDTIVPIAKIEPLSDYVLNILEHGGIKKLIKEQLRKGE